MKKKYVILGMIVTALFLSACGNGNQVSENNNQSNSQTEVGSQTESELTSETESETETETEPETETESESEITEILISAVGDCTFGHNQKQGYSKSFDEYYDNYGADYFFQNVRSVFEADDFTIVNLEGPLTTSDTIRTTKEWIHVGKPEYVNVLTGSSVEAVTLGNNHIMDYNAPGVADTIQTVSDAGLAYAIDSGWGHALGTYEVKGIKIGFVSVNEYYDGTRVYEWLEDGIANLREQGCDLVIAAMHWGGDKVHELEENQYIMGKWCIDQGYDLVIGCHPHVIQGIEEYNGKYIVYSMGNFCYGGNRNPAEKESMIFQAKFTFVDGVLQPQTEGKVIPCRLSSVTNKNDYCPTILTGEEGQKVIDQLNGYSAEFGLFINEDGSITTTATEEEAESETETLVE